MYDLYGDLMGRDSSYGYYQADKKRMAAKRLRDKISAEVRKEVARQEERYIEKIFDELQIYFNSHTFEM